MDNTALAVDRKPIRRAFSYIGFCYTVLLVVSTVVQLLLVYAPMWLLGEQNPLLGERWWSWLCMMIPLYGAAMPLCYLMMRRLPATPPEKHKLSAKQILALIPICMFLMYAGNFIGSVLSLLLSCGHAQNGVIELAEDNHPLKFVMMVIAAPILEEWICRKVLLDRVHHHGELISAVMSGVIFGLLHQNFFQFFSAFALGLVFSWIYLKSGRLLIPVLFHMGINFMGAVVAPALLSLTNTYLQSYTPADTLTIEMILLILLICAVLLLYIFALFALSVTGLIVLLCNLRNIKWKPNPYGLSFNSMLNSALLNSGMIVYTAICAVMFILSLIM